MNLRFATVFGSLSLLLAAGLMGGCSRHNAATKISAGEKSLLKVGFQLDWYPAPEHGGYYQALVKHYYEDAGLDVTIAHGGPGAYPLQRVATGKIQFAMGHSDDVILAVKQGLPLLIVGVFMQHCPQAILVHAESPVKSLRDLDGKSVMCTPGSNWIAFLKYRYGINFNAIPLDFGLARFMADKNFIQQCFISNEPYHVELQGVKTRALLIADGGYDPYRVIFTSKNFAKEHPEAVRAFVAGTNRGWAEFINGDATDARARIQQENPSQVPALMDYSIAAMKRYKIVEGDPAKGERLGMLTRARMEEMTQMLVALKVLDAPLPLKEFVSFDFLPPELTGAK